MSDAPYLNELQQEAAEPIPNSPRERLKYLTKLRNEITFEITRLRSMLGLPLLERPTWNCRRCGNEWPGFSIERPPKSCPRCHSAGWNEEPVSKTARRPSDPPNPRWKHPARVSTAAPAPTILRPIPLPRSDVGGFTLPPPPVFEDIDMPPAVKSLADQLRERIEDSGGGGSTVERDPSKVDQAGSTPVPRSNEEQEAVSDEDPSSDPSPSK